MPSGIEEQNVPAAAAAGSNPPSMEKPRDVEVPETEAAAPVCPAHTSERRLMTKIDFHVVPFLCIMYLLAFLGMYPP